MDFELERFMGLAVLSHTPQEYFGFFELLFGFVGVVSLPGVRFPFRMKFIGCEESTKSSSSLSESKMRRFRFAFELDGGVFLFNLKSKWTFDGVSIGDISPFLCSRITFENMLFLVISNTLAFSSVFGLSRHRREIGVLMFIGFGG